MLPRYLVILVAICIQVVSCRTTKEDSALESTKTKGNTIQWKKNDFPEQMQQLFFKQYFLPLASLDLKGTCNPGNQGLIIEGYSTPLTPTEISRFNIDRPLPDIKNFANFYRSKLENYSPITEANLDQSIKSILSGFKKLPTACKEGPEMYEASIVYTNQLIGSELQTATSNYAIEVTKEGAMLFVGFATKENKVVNVFKQKSIDSSN